MIGDDDFEAMKAQLGALLRRVDALERRVVRKDHLLRIIRDTADDELDQGENSEVNGENGGQP